MTTTKTLAELSWDYFKCWAVKTSKMLRHFGSDHLELDNPSIGRILVGKEEVFMATQVRITMV